MSSMVKPESVLEIFLQPGDVYFGDEDTRLRTLLGSCISITLWHPQRKIGGMCHYMLPSCAHRQEDRPEPDGRYADEAIMLLMKEIRHAKTKPSEYHVKLFGGGSMLRKPAKKSGHSLAECDPPNIPLRNIEVGRALLQQHGFVIKTEQVGGSGQRYVIFDIWSGHVWVRQSKLEEAA